MMPIMSAFCRAVSYQ